MMLLKIAVNAPLDNTLTYSVPESLLTDAEKHDLHLLVGRRVLVPLGGRKVTGYVLGEAETANIDFKIRNIQKIIDTQPIFFPQIIPLFEWIAAYYHYPIGEVIKSALPGGMTPKSVKFLQLTGQAGKNYQILETFKDDGWAVTLRESGRLSPTLSKELLSDSRTKKYVKQLVDSGLLEIAEAVTDDTVREKLEICYRSTVDLPDLPEERSEKDMYTCYQKHVKDLHQFALKLSEAKTLHYLNSLKGSSDNSFIPRKELTAAYSGASKAIGTLIDNGFILEKKNRVFRNPLGEQLEFFPPPKTLTEEQDEALKEINVAIQKEIFAPFLLHGVTGSGKTEVYLNAAAKTLERGRGVLVIVPEIALATQLEAHFVSRFGDQVVLLHSGLSASEKFDQWSLALSGKAKIVIGARSAIFAPLENPGLIVVDEEHDAGLKQDDSLRYNGRDVAVVRAKYQKAVLLLGSATPSVVSYHNAITGKYRLITMNNRVGQRAMPKVRIIDLKKNTTGKKRHLFSPELKKALLDNLEREKQSVILINRRGFSTNVICGECGTPVQCKDCHVSLTLHKSKQQLLCHYCGYAVHHKTVCESCHSTNMVPIGFGTERVEEELQKLLPEARIARLDLDTTRNRKEFLHTLKLMRDGGIDVLVGTQMVAKGHHFPGVTLVGVVWADGGLSIPDYRAAEKTFQLVTQVTGRAGRGDSPGEVFIQTMRPDHYAIQFAKAHSYGDLVEKELELRRNPLFPPFVRVVMVHVRGESEDNVQLSAMRIAAACRSITETRKNEIEILGPAPSPIDRVKKNYRWQILLKGPAPDVLHSVCGYIRMHKDELVTGRCKVIVDVDPENML
ncbi:replication restart helicase PriA [Desulfosediminicola flagellatus]|uniref:replication restart helicase PriA n=1 Tax=Desulfosediminicola flagellatus TaxID=2569541 RepID=UPI0010ACDC1A|nr:primosomal protein N' [Desulfosediminicola flagellatus]